MAALVLVMLATLALIASAELPGQRGFAFGPGTAPRLFCIILAGLGAAVALTGLVTVGAAHREIQDPRAGPRHHRNLSVSQR